MRMSWMVVILTLQSHIALVRAPSRPVNRRIEAGIPPHSSFHMNPAHDTVVGDLLDLRSALAAASELQGGLQYGQV